MAEGRTAYFLDPDNHTMMLHNCTPDQKAFIERLGAEEISEEAYQQIERDRMGATDEDEGPARGQ